MNWKKQEIFKNIKRAGFTARIDKITGIFQLNNINAFIKKKF